MDASEVSFRAFRPGDGAGVVDVLREYYKDDYYHAACYDPEYLEKCSQDGRRVIFVAESPEDGIVGVVDGYYRAYFPGSYELGLHVFKRAYQGRGLARRLLAFCADTVGKMHIYGVYGMAIAVHDRSQYECESVGLPATGFWLGRYRADRSFFEEKPRSPKLHSVVVARPGAARNTGALYVPEEFRDFVDDAYRRLHTPFAFAPDGACMAELSSYYVKDTEDAANREIFVRSLGEDLPDQVRDLMHGRSDMDGYTVFLNMLNRGCAHVCARLLDMGFYFTGVHPLHDHGEFMILHRECASGYDWSEACLTPTNRRILDYILEHKNQREG